jgi:hypothetical protein
MPNQPAKPQFKPRGIAQLTPPPRERGPVRTSRAYVHYGCGTETIISGGDFKQICNPLTLCIETYCCGCSDYVTLQTVAWTDTGETIAAYRNRLRAATPKIIAP